MDEWARIRNPAVLPFTVSDTTRILAVSMWWSGIFPVQVRVRVRVRVSVRVRVRVRGPCGGAASSPCR